jgi:hypothetical protein
LWAAAGRLKVTSEIMPKKTKNDTLKQKLQQVVDLLKFALTLNDEEITRSTIESVVESLEEEINK